MFDFFKRKNPLILERSGPVFITPEALETLVRALQIRVSTLESANVYSKEQLRKHEEAAGGGFWKTANGHLLRIRDMNTDHIKRCLAGNFAKVGGRAQCNMNIELRRRDEWHSQPMLSETKPKEEEDGFVGLIDDTPVYVDENVGIMQVQRIRALIAKARIL